jgi:hypothetical protein
MLILRGDLIFSPKSFISFSIPCIPRLYAKNMLLKLPFAVKQGEQKPIDASTTKKPGLGDFSGLEVDGLEDAVRCLKLGDGKQTPLPFIGHIWLNMVNS